MSAVSYRFNDAMKNTRVLVHLLVGLLFSVNTLAQTAAPAAKMSVNERMAKARAAKKEKRMTPAEKTPMTSKFVRATPADYSSPVDKTQKGPNGEKVYTGDRGGKYYINKNGNKTFLSSNQ
jgi:hypothetical protein